MCRRSTSTDLYQRGSISEGVKPSEEIWLLLGRPGEHLQKSRELLGKNDEMARMARMARVTHPEDQERLFITARLKLPRGNFNLSITKTIPSGRHSVSLFLRRLSLVRSYWEGTSLRLFCREVIVGLFLPRGNDLPLSAHWACKGPVCPKPCLCAPEFSEVSKRGWRREGVDARKPFKARDSGLFSVPFFPMPS